MIMNNFNPLIDLDANPSFQTDETRGILFENKTIGGGLSQKIEGIYHTALALKKAYEIASHHGSRLFTSGMTIAAGAKEFSEGKYVKGTLVAAVGAKQLMDVLYDINSKNHFISLLNDASAGVGMIQTLEEANTSSFREIQLKLSSIESNMAKMHDRMGQIKSTCVKHGQELLNFEEELFPLYKKADEEFSNAKHLFEKGEDVIRSSNEAFNQALTSLNSLKSLAENPDISDKEKVAQFVTILQSVDHMCRSAQSLMNEGNESIRLGTECLERGRHIESEAQTTAGLAINQALLTIKMVEALSVCEKESEKEMHQIKEKLDRIEQNNQAIRKLLEELISDLEEAKKRCCDNIGMFSFYLGACPGAALGSTAGAMGAAIGAVSGAKIVHNRDAIFDTMDHLLNGPRVFLDSDPDKKEPVTVKFSNRSTGFFGRFVQNRQSYTAGVVEFLLGNEPVVLSFNLNKEYPISKVDLYQLQQKICKKVAKGDLTAEEALDLIHNLETKEIYRGKNHKTKKGFVSKDNPYFRCIKDICHTSIKNETRVDPSFLFRF